MIVTRANLDSVIQTLELSYALGFDTETTGLRPFHGDLPFSLVFATPDETFYFNFQSRPDIPMETVFGRDVLMRLDAAVFSNPGKLLYAQNAKFDLHMMGARGIRVLCQIHDIWTGAVILDNSHMSYGLAAIAERMGKAKSNAVEEYVTKNKLWEWVRIPGKQKRDKNKFYDQVPFPIITEYAMLDARLAYDIGFSQESAISACEKDPHEAPIYKVMRNEIALTPILADMERRGVVIDPDFCTRAAKFEQDRADAACAEFEQLTGYKFKASMKLYADVFKPFADKWQYNKATKTGKVNPCFDSDVLKTFRSPIADAVLKFRDAKSKADFYYGFLFHMDADNVIHANFKPAGAMTGRFASSEPNLQNLTSEEDEAELAQEFVVRRAFIPRPGHIFIMPDYSAMEYRMMLDVAAQMDLIEKIMSGHDVHQATADLAGITRKAAKTLNFGLLYGMGVGKLADSLNITRDEAYTLRRTFFDALPKIAEFLSDIKDVAERRGWIVNWMGRRSYFPDPKFGYKAANYYIQGGCADVMKVAMVNIGQWLEASGLKSRMVLTIHDELVLEVPYDEVDVVPQRVLELMESAYPYKILPMKVEMEWSAISLADKVKGFPDGQKIRDQLSQQHRSAVAKEAAAH